MKELYLRACGPRVIVDQDSLDEVTESGIIIKREKQDAEQAAVMRGKLVAIGDDCWQEYESDWANLGDDILFAKYAGKNIIDPVTGKVYLIMNAIDIICVLLEKKET